MRDGFGKRSLEEKLREAETELWRQRLPRIPTSEGERWRSKNGQLLYRGTQQLQTLVRILKKFAKFERKE